MFNCLINNTFLHNFLYLVFKIITIIFQWLFNFIFKTKKKQIPKINKLLEKEVIVRSQTFFFKIFIININNMIDSGARLADLKSSISSFYWKTKKMIV